MSTSPEMLRFIRHEIRRTQNVVLHGVSGTSNDGFKESIGLLHPGMTTEVVDRPVLMPFGFSSRALPGTELLSVRVGDHLSARVIIGHLDRNRPLPENPGESIQYNATGSEVRLKADGKILIKNNVTDLVTEVVALIDQLIAALVVDPVSGPTPFSAATIAAFNVIKLKLETMKP